MWTHRVPRFPDHSLDWFPLSVLKSNALGHIPQRLVHSLYVWLAREETRVQPHRTFCGRSLAHCLYGQTIHPWLKRPHVTICYTLNFDLVNDAASRGFLVLACHLATPWTLVFVTDAALRGFPVLAWHLGTPCDRRCIAWFLRDTHVILLTGLQISLKVLAYRIQMRGTKNWRRIFVQFWALFLPCTSWFCHKCWVCIFLSMQVKMG